MATALQRDFFARRAFPTEEIQAAVRDFFDHEAEAQAPLYRDAQVAGDASIGLAGPVIDSYEVVELLVELEPICSMQLPESLVQPGGYDSVKELLDDLLPKMEARWQRTFP